MLNQVVLVGRISKEFETITLDNSREEFKLELSVQRPFKNEKNKYETDFIPIIFSKELAKSMVEIVEKGSMIAIKARIESKKSLRIYAEKVSCLSAGKNNGQE